jgi:dUTP pyrophosphatase
MAEEHNGGVLNRELISELLDAVPPLVEGMIDRDAQLQPNGIDLTLESVARFSGPGTLTWDNQGRQLPGTEELVFDPNGQLYLQPGSYLVRFNETVNLPQHYMAYARPRSSLLRSGAALHTAVWDAGYRGRGVALLVVYSPHGFRVEHNARIVQLVFHRLAKAAAAGYQGIYQGEATERSPTSDRDW